MSYLLREMDIFHMEESIIFSTFFLLVAFSSSYPENNPQGNYSAFSFYTVLVAYILCY